MGLLRCVLRGSVPRPLLGVGTPLGRINDKAQRQRRQLRASLCGEGRRQMEEASSLWNSKWSHKCVFSQHWGHPSDRVLRKSPSVSTEVRSHLEPSHPPFTGCRALCLSVHIWLLFPPARAANLPPSRWASRQGWGWTWPGEKGDFSKTPLTRDLGECF